MNLGYPGQSGGENTGGTQETTTPGEYQAKYSVNRLD